MINSSLYTIPLDLQEMATSISAPTDASSASAIILGQYLQQRTITDQRTIRNRSGGDVDDIRQREE